MLLINYIFIVEIRFNQKLEINQEYINSVNIFLI